MHWCSSSPFLQHFSSHSIYPVTPGQMAAVKRQRSPTPPHSWAPICPASPICLRRVQIPQTTVEHLLVKGLITAPSTHIHSHWHGDTKTTKWGSFLPGFTLQLGWGRHTRTQNKASLCPGQTLLEAQRWARNDKEVITQQSQREGSGRHWYQLSSQVSLSPGG